MNDDTPIGDVFGDAQSDDDLTDETAGMSGTFVGDDVRCSNCVHRSVCAVYATLADGVTSVEQSGLASAVNPDEIAIICDEFEREEE